MSKQGGSKSRAEKIKGGTSVIVPVTNDIVPGKYTELDLNLSIEQENTDEFIFSLINNIIQDTDKHINDKYLNNRIVPFTVNLARNAMLKIIEWNFLCHDPGELDLLDNVWIEDIEPESCTIDSWAQGYFPKRQASFEFGHHPTEITELILDENSKMEESEEELEESIAKFSMEFIENESISSIQKEKDEVMENEQENIESIDMNSLFEENVVKNISKKKVPFKPYHGKLNFEDLNMLTETLSETEQRLEIENMKREAKMLRGTSSRSTTSRQTENVDYERKVIQKLFGTTVKNHQQLRTGDILLNTNEQLVAMMKIPSDQLIAQRIKANHKTLDLGLSRATLVANKGNSIKNKQTNQEKTHINSTKQENCKMPMTQNDKHPLPVSMLDSIDPVPGVVVQEGDRIKKSTNKKLDREKQMEKEFLHLRPVKNQPPQSAYLIEDIIKVNSVNIKPFSTLTPIPPIADSFELFD